MEHSEGTPVETALPVDTPVSAKRVVEAGRSTLSERVSASRVGWFTLQLIVRSVHPVIVLRTGRSVVL